MIDGSLNQDGIRMGLFVFALSAMAGGLIGWSMPFVQIIEVVFFMTFLVFWTTFCFKQTWFVYAVCTGVTLGMFPTALIAQIFQVIRFASN
jgi:hypothetical protein